MRTWNQVEREFIESKRSSECFVDLLPEEFELASISFLESCGIGNLRISMKRKYLELLVELNKEQEKRISQSDRSEFSKYFIEKDKLLELCRENGLAIIPENMTFLRKLNYLDLSYNRIENIPRHLENLVNLSKLDLSYNRLKEIENVSWSKLTKLEMINLSGNEVERIPVDLEQIIIRNGGEDKKKILITQRNEAVKKAEYEKAAEYQEEHMLYGIHL